MKKLEQNIKKHTRHVHQTKAQFVRQLQVLMKNKWA